MFHNVKQGVLSKLIKTHSKLFFPGVTVVSKWGKKAATLNRCPQKRCVSVLSALKHRRGNLCGVHTR